MIPSLDPRHPTYSTSLTNWMKWRTTYAGGDDFIRRYLIKYSQRETDVDFDNRKLVAYNPAFAKAAINEIKDSIFQRMLDIKRLTGPKAYQQAIQGLDGGVDNELTTMNTFIGQMVLPELLVMRCVGIYVDMPEQVGATLAEQSSHPYIYTYCVEDILNWSFTRIQNAMEFSAIELRDYAYVQDPVTGLPTGETTIQTRKMWLKDGFVNLQYVPESGTPGPVTVLKIKRIPFVLAEISESLMADVANYQIALMNLASSDLNYTLLANFPFYTEQDNSTGIPTHLKGETNAEGKREIQVGATAGRTYGKGMERPGFIHPSSEPLIASMAKQDKMKEEIRQLVQLAVSHLQPKMASAESKSYDSRGLEAGLSCIGLELERVERKIGEFWAAYDGSTAPEVTYPKNYMLKTDDDRLNEAEKMAKRLLDAPSLTYRKEICKKIANILLSGSSPTETLQKIDTEIDAAVGIVNDPVMLDTLLKYGVIGNLSAGQTQGLPESEPAAAAKDHAERIARIQAAQAPAGGAVKDAGARGVNDQSANPGLQAATEKN